MKSESAQTKLRPRKTMKYETALEAIRKMFGGEKLCKILQNIISKNQSIIQSFMLADCFAKRLKAKVERKLECTNIALFMCKLIPFKISIYIAPYAFLTTDIF